MNKYRSRQDLKERRNTIWRMVSEGKSIKEIAEALGVSRQAIYNTLSRMRKANG